MPSFQDILVRGAEGKGSSTPQPSIGLTTSYVRMYYTRPFCHRLMPLQVLLTLNGRSPGVFVVDAALVINHYALSWLGLIYIPASSKLLPFISYLSLLSIYLLHLISNHHITL